MGRLLDKLWIVLILFLIVSIISGGVILVIKQVESKPVEIIITPPKVIQYQGQIHIDGAITNPGYYSWKEGDTLQALLQSAGLKPEADFNRLKIYIPKIGETYPPQKVNINRAEVWLLQALPGIGPARAQAIINYRTQRGPFLRPEDLLKVEGIGRFAYERIKDLITVED